MLMNANGDECHSEGGGGMSGANHFLLLRPQTRSSLRCIIVSPARRHLGKQSINVIGVVRHLREEDLTLKARETRSKQFIL